MDDLPTIEEIRTVYYRRGDIEDEIARLKAKQKEYMHIAKIDKLHNQILTEFNKREKKLILILEALILAQNEMSQTGIDFLRVKKPNKTYINNAKNSLANYYIQKLCRKTQDIIKDILFN